MGARKRTRTEGAVGTSRMVMAVAACIALSASAAKVDAAESRTASPVGIDSVWDVDISCGDFAAIAKSRRPDEAAIRSSGRVDLPGTGFSFVYAGLKGMDDATLMLALDDASRGVRDHYVLLAKDDISPPEAAIVVTELPEHLVGDPRSALLTAVTQQVSAASGHPGATVSFSHLSGGSVGPAIEMIVPGRTGSPCFPTAHFKLYEEGQAPTLGLSIFIPDGRYLFEYSLIAPVQPGVPMFDSISNAREQMKRLLASIHQTSGLSP